MSEIDFQSAVIIAHESGKFSDGLVARPIGAQKLAGEIVAGRIVENTWYELGKLDLLFTLEVNVVDDVDHKIFYIALLGQLPPNVYVALVQRATPSMVAVTPVFVPLPSDKYCGRTYYLRGVDNRQVDTAT